MYINIKCVCKVKGIVREKKTRRVHTYLPANSPKYIVILLLFIGIIKKKNMTADSLCLLLIFISNCPYFVTSTPGNKPHISYQPSALSRK